MQNVGTVISCIGIRFNQRGRIGDMQTTKPTETTAAAKRIAEQTEAYLKAGGKITQVPGFTPQPVRKVTNYDEVQIDESI